ncbi:tRNA dimethylallyltransferase 9 [Dionaea muscipula]
MSGVGGLRLWGAWGLRIPLSRPLHCNPGRLPFSFRRRVSFSTMTTTCSISTKKNADKQKVIVISGPTGAGKSRLAMELAKRLNGEIISADSVQVYRGLDVGSAKPSWSERKEVCHHLLDILHPSEEYSVGQFYEDARQATKDTLKSGHVPIVVGGTGLYLRWFIYGKPDVPKSSPEITSEVYSQLEGYRRNGDWDAAVQLVVEAGDLRARSLKMNDWYRLQRSLEIIKTSGAPPSAFQVPYDSLREQLSLSREDCSLDVASPNDTVNEDHLNNLDYNFICFFISSHRVDLYRAIDLRCEDMLSGRDGLLSEAKWLLDIGLLPNMNSATRAIGYKQAMEYLLDCREQGRSSPKGFSAFLSEFQKASRNFAKRQMTWFRNELIYHWLDGSRPMEKVLSFIHDTYLNQSGRLLVPESLKLKRDLTTRREIAELKAYRTANRYFTGREDCADILAWIRTEVCNTDEDADPVGVGHGSAIKELVL